MSYLVALLTIIVLQFAGAAMALFGPTQGRLIGVPAFIASLFLLGILDEKSKRGALPGVAADCESIFRFRRSLHVLMIACVVVFVMAKIVSLTSSDGMGVADGSRPIFEHQDNYCLNNHGNFTTVTRDRYLVVGTSFVIGMNTFLLLFALLGLHLVLFGSHPPWIDQKTRNSQDDDPNAKDQSVEIELSK